MVQWLESRVIFSNWSCIGEYTSMSGLPMLLGLLECNQCRSWIVLVYWELSLPGARGRTKFAAMGSTAASNSCELSHAVTDGDGCPTEVYLKYVEAASLGPLLPIVIIGAINSAAEISGIHPQPNCSADMILLYCKSV